ncbi:MAG: type IV pilin [Methanocellales archaeon]|nr:type IV pilin [Methanocellales archaeon]
MKEDMLKRNEEAVSPVIGEILMVAIVVILAAVVAAYVFGMTPPKMAPDLHFTSVVATANNNNVTMTAIGTASVPAGDLRATINDVSVTITPTSIDAGDKVTLSDGPDFSAGDSIHVIIVHVPTGNLLLDQTVIARSE